MSNKYNGWTNYETWNFNLWITNTERDYSHARKLAMGCINEYQLAKQLEKWATRMADDVFSSCEHTHGFINDIVNSSIREVNFLQVAVGLWDEVHDEEEE